MKYRTLAAMALLTASAAALAQAAPQYKAIDIADLKVDLQALAGKRVSTKALIQTMGQVHFIKGDAMDMSPILATIDGLPRDDRKKLLNSCQMVPCQATFYGVVRPTPMGLGIKLERTEWN